MQKRKGISLIVLVITIIVMIILAGAIVVTLNNSGIIDKASDAVEDSNLATVKELASLGWAEAYADGARTKEALEEGVYEILEANNVDTEAYGIIVTTSGVKVANGWIQEGLTVKRGSTVLTIGDDFEYDETAEGTTDVAWKVLGASEDGELLIMSTSHIALLDLGDLNYEDLEKCQNDWLTGATQLDNLCEPYGTGESATGARSIRVEDVDKITGFDKTTYGKGTLGEYGNEVTYSYNGTTKPAYTATNKLSGTLTGAHSNGFHYYNGTDFVVADLSTATGIITTLKSDYYYYYAPDLETIDKTSKAYTMLFGEYGAEDTYYWLASPDVDAHTDYALFGMRGVGGGYVNGYDLWNSYGDCACNEDGVRAVVSLASDITVTGDSTNGWSY